EPARRVRARPRRRRGHPRSCRGRRRDRSARRRRRGPRPPPRACARGHRRGRRDQRRGVRAHRLPHRPPLHRPGRDGGARGFLVPAREGPAAALGQPPLLVVQHLLTPPPPRDRRVPPGSGRILGGERSTHHQIRAVTTLFDVQRIGGDRLRIHGCAASEAPAGRRPLPRNPPPAPGGGPAPPAPPAALAPPPPPPPRGGGASRRALRDHVSPLTRPAEAFSVEIAPAIEGRVRLRLPGLGDDDLVRLAAWLKDRRGVTRASASPASRSILVLFDPAETTA